MTNEFFNTAGSDRNREVVCADGFKMSVQAHAGAYCLPRMSGAPVYREVEVGFPSKREEMLMKYAEAPGPNRNGLCVCAGPSCDERDSKARRYC